MRITAVLNLKGGVAKTTTVLSMADILAREYNKRVLVIDADSQCNTTEFLGGDPMDGNLAGLLRRAQNLVEPGAYGLGLVQKTVYPGISLLCGDDSLMDMDLSKVEQQAVSTTVIRDLAWAGRKDYDIVLIDCPPAFNAASAAALVAAHDVVIPIKLDAFSLRGMGNLMRQIKNMQRINPCLRLAGVLPTMWYKDPQIAQAEEALIHHGMRVFPHIRQSKKVDTMTFEQKPLSSVSAHSGAYTDYRRFVKCYLREG